MDIDPSAAAIFTPETISPNDIATDKIFGFLKAIYFPTSDTEYPKMTISEHQYKHPAHTSSLPKN